MKVDELFALAKDSISVRRVFAEPVEKDGVTVIAVATVGGGGGGGGGKDKDGQEGEGGGFGIGAKPAGVYTIKDGKVRWVPAVDVNRLFTVVGAVAIVFLISRSRTARRKH
jgi:uncharacterized spore protein YtfJ